MKIGVRRRMLILDFNFTKKIENVELTVIALKKLIYIDPDTLEGVLYLNNTLSTIKFDADIKTDEGVLKGFKTTSETIGAVAGTVGAIGLGVALTGSFFQMQAMGYLVKFLMMFKILDRFKLLNIYYGEILGAFLESVGNILNLTGGSNPDDGIKYYPKTRGKLSKYNIHNLAFYRMPLKYSIYIVSFKI